MTAFNQCPFCEESENIEFCVPENGNIVFVECHKCGACGPSVENAVYDEALRMAKDAWNLGHPRKLVVLEESK